MGKTNRHEQRPDRQNRDLVSQPFKSALQGFKVAGTECISCSAEIDTRFGFSVVTNRGSRRSVRQGYLCPTCEESQSKKFSDIKWEEDKDTGRFLQFVLVNKQLPVPVYTEDELHSIINELTDEVS